MATVTTLPRIFMHGQLELEDIHPSMTPEETRNHYAGIYNELTQAVIEGPDYTQDAEVYTFRKSVGTKGISLKEIAEGKIVQSRKSKNIIDVNDESKSLMQNFVRAISGSNDTDFLLPSSLMLPPI